jgi:hypothetical protein
LHSGTWLSDRTCTHQKCPRRAGRSPGWLATRAAAAGSGWAGCGIPSTSLQGYHTAARGQSQIINALVPSRAAPGLPCGRATPDRRDATPVPVCKIDGDANGTVRSLSRQTDSEAADPESDVWQPADRRSEPATKDPPGLHQLVHQRLWTTMDILGREPKNQARSWTDCRSGRGAACDYGTEGIRRRPRYARARAAVRSWSHLWSHPSTFAYVHWYSDQCGDAGRDVNGIRRTIIQTSENRNVDGATLTSPWTRMNEVWPSRRDGLRGPCCAVLRWA